MNGYRVLEVSEEFDYVVEQGTNNGPGVRMCQGVTGNKPPDPWCASYVSLCLFHAYRGNPPFKLSGGCDELLRAMRDAGLERATPVAPGVFFVMAAIKDREGKPTGKYSTTDAEHVAFVISVNTNTFFTREGNTSGPAKPGETLTDAQLREGRLVGKRWRPITAGKYVFCALP